MTHRTVLSGMAGRARTRARRPAPLGIAVLGILSLGGCATPAGESTGAERAALSGAEATMPAGTPSDDPDAAPESDGEADIDPMPSDGQTPVAGRPWDADASALCGDQVPSGLEEVAQAVDDSGVTSFWSGGDRWVACDLAGSKPVLLEPRTGDAAGFDERSLAISSTATDGGARHTAAGLLPWPVQELTYTFPDGHTEHARFVATEGAPDQVWWVVSYTATDGPLADTDATGLGAVTVSAVGAAAEAFRFGWDELQRTE